MSSNIDLTRESSLLMPVSEYIKRKGYAIQIAELTFYDRRIDLYGLWRKKNKTIAIELKLHNWKKAIKQAAIYQLCADKAYIAMPEKFTGPIDVNLFKRYGVGLIIISDAGKCKTVIRAKQSSMMRTTYKTHQISCLGENPCP